MYSHTEYRHSECALTHNMIYTFVQELITISKSVLFPKEVSEQDYSLAIVGIRLDNRPPRASVKVAQSTPALHRNIRVCAT